MFKKYKTMLKREFAGYNGGAADDGVVDADYETVD